MARTELEQLVYTMSADISRLTKQNERALAVVRQKTGEIERRYGAMGANINKTLNGIGNSFQKLSGPASIAFAAISTYAIKAASDAQEIENAFTVAFGNSAKEGKEFAVTLADEVGRSATEIQSSMSRLQLVLTGMGMAGEQALSITEELSKRAIDIGSLWNVSDAEAFQAIISGITGEAEPMKKFGAVINETAVKAELLRLGFKGNAEQASEQAKAVARANLILQKTASANGDAARTADSTANSFKRAKAEFHDAAIKLGEELLPAATKAINAAADLAEEFNDMPASVKIASLSLLGLVAASGPIAAVITGLSKVIAFAKEAKIALAGVGGAGAGGAAAGAGGGAAVAGGGAALAAYTGVGLVGYAGYDAFFGAGRQSQLRQRAVHESPGSLSEADLKAASAQARAILDKAVGEGSVVRVNGRVQGVGGRALHPHLARLQATLDAAEAELKKRSAAGSPSSVEADAQAQAALATLSSFGLSGNQLTSAGSPEDEAKARREAERAGAEALARERRTDDMIFRAKEQRATAEGQLALTADERLQADLDALQFERDAAEIERKRLLADGEIDAARFAELEAAQDAAFLAREAVIRREAALERDEARLDAEARLAEYGLDLLYIQADTAKTAEERHRAELEALKATRALARKRLEEALSSDLNLTPEQRSAELAAFDRVTDAQYGALADRQREDMKASILGAFDAARGGAGSLADYFGDRMKAKLVDNLAETVANLLMQLSASGGGSGGGGWMSTAISAAGSFFGGFRAAGGPVSPGKAYVVGERRPELFVPNVAGRIEPNLGRLGGGGTVISLTTNVYADDTIVHSQFEQMIARSSVQTLQAARTLVQQDFARKQRSRMA